MTTLRNAWIAPQPVLPRRVYATVKASKQRGIVWDGVPLAVQVARDAIAVCFGDGQPAQYYRKDEVEFDSHKRI